jgi:hypothetical protein
MMEALALHCAAILFDGMKGWTYLCIGCGNREGIGDAGFQSFDAVTEGRSPSSLSFPVAGVDSTLHRGRGGHRKICVH